MGMGGFTTQDMNRSPVTVRAVALVYNWWSWYVRAANPQARREALTSRPLLMAAAGQATNSGNQTTLYLTPMPAAKARSAGLAAVFRITPDVGHLIREGQQDDEGLWTWGLPRRCRRQGGYRDEACHATDVRVTTPLAGATRRPGHWLGG
jgi:hypothetical protein